MRRTCDGLNSRDSSKRPTIPNPFSRVKTYGENTAEMVIDWPFWKDLGGDALEKHMSGNVEKFLRLA